MFDSITVPRSSISAYCGIPTQKEYAVEYMTNSNVLHNVKIGFVENSNELTVLSGVLEAPLTGCWQVVLRDLKDAQTYRVSLLIKDNELLEVVDAKGLVWRVDTAIPGKLHDEVMHLAGCFDLVKAAETRNQKREGFWS